ncbi:MAG: T9SS type A sorting domain-containing protein [Bacteroidetes bacterium]|nr:T9SS type A sorting domain-containing protein [Bacteroidota bacterium]MCW5897067.1 T9SS type A sorting domain-containing protein [Bacteroidota bacterium]
MITSISVGAFGQAIPPAVNGIITPNEYGLHINGAHAQASGTAVWYMAWSADSLYVGITGVSADDASIIYLDVNPLAPINGGTNADGLMNGTMLNNTNFDALPFRADRVVFCTSLQRTMNSANGQGGWNSAVSSAGSYAWSGTTREFSIPWTALGGLPSTFAWFGYIAGSTGVVYAGVPMENPTGTIGQAARFERYYKVSSTAANNSTWPFSQNSFVFNRTTDATLTTNLHVHDLTMNSPGRTLTRATNTNTWITSGNLRVDAGTISFGGSYGSATVRGDAVIGQAGSLVLSSNASGDLYVEGDLILNGAFNPDARMVTFSGTGNSSLVGNAVLRNLSISKTAGAVVGMTNDCRVNGTLALISGNIRLNGDANLIVGDGGDITGGADYSYVITAGNGRLAREAVGNNAAYFPVGTESSFNPVTIANTGTPDIFRVGVKPALSVPVSNPQRVVNREWHISEAILGGSNATVSFQWNGADHGATFNPAEPAYTFNYNGSQWASTLAAVTGADPYTATVNGLTQFDTFIVGNAGVTSVTGMGSKPEGFALHQNYPNPFNPSTDIKFSVETSGRATLDVYTMLGQKVATLFDGIAEAGQYHTIRVDASGLASGMYLYKLQSGSRTDLKKMLLLK